MPDPVAPDLRCSDTCWRCGDEKCIGRYHLPACEVLVDGLDALGEAYSLLMDKYRPKPEQPAPPVPARVAVPIENYELLGGDVLIPWDGDRDRRPRAKNSPRIGETDIWSQWGECTACARDRTPMRAARWRQQKARSQRATQSLCDEHARALVDKIERMRNPVEIPQFSTAEEAMAWLEAQTDALAP